MISPNITLLAAFVAGIVSFLSPCVLPLVPGYIGLVSGMSYEELTRPRAFRGTLRGAFLFVLGFSLVFTLLGAFASGLASPLAPYLPLLRRVAGLVVILFGLHTLRVLPLGFLYRQLSFDLGTIGGGGVTRPFVVGMAFAFGWTPCVGPILASVLALAATEGGIGHGMALLFAYSLGIGVPFLLTSLGVGSLLQLLRRTRRLVRAVELASGVLLVAVGVLIFTNQLALIVAPFPFLNRFVS